MRIYKNYISAILRKYKKTFKDYFIIQTILVVLALISSIVAIYLMNYSGKIKAALIIGLLEFVPIIGSGLYLCYQVIINLIKDEVVIASNLSVLYLTILSVRFILEPVLLGRKLNFKIFLVIFIALISRIFGGSKGLAIASVVIFVLNTLIDMNEIYSFERKRILKERKEKRLREREKRKHFDYENLGE